MGTLGIPHLERYWSRCLAVREGGPTADGAEFAADHTLLSGLGLGLEETIEYLFRQAPTLAEFEAWILERNGGSLDAARTARINRALAGDAAAATLPEPIFSPAEIAYWERNG